MRLASLTLVLSVLALLASCATLPASTTNTTSETSVGFRLPPGSLGHALSWQQHLQVTAQGRAHPPVDALLEVDEHSVRLALLGAGRTLARLQWDGQTLQAEQGTGWPPAIPAERVLSDLQLALWPLKALQAALPTDATLTDEGPLRVLRQRGLLVATVRDAGMAHIELVNHALQYTLHIDSVPLGGDAR